MVYTFVIIATIFSCYDATDSAIFERIPAKSGQVCSGHGVLIDETDSSVLGCGLKCVSRSDCQRFYYEESQQLCIGCSSVLNNDTTLPDSICYARQISYLGCFQDYNGARVLLKDFMQSELHMTNEMCFQFCIVEKNFRYAGTQQPGLCFCGDTYEAAGQLDDSQCNHVCVGDSTQYCGGGWKNSIYYKP